MTPYSVERKNIFIVGIVCLVLSLGFLLFALYIVPYLVFNTGYNVPEFVMNFTTLLQEKYRYSSAGSKFVVWMVFVIPGLITGFISHYISHYLDRENKL